MAVPCEEVSKPVSSLCGLSTIYRVRPPPLAGSATRRVPNVPRPNVVRPFSPCDVNVGAVPGNPVVVSVREGVPVLGLVVEPGDELGHLSLRAPSLPTIRGTPEPGVEPARAVILPR